MCGIIGIIGNHNKSEVSEIMLKLKERGPDRSYSLHGENFYIGLSRLSIVSPQEHDLPFSFGNVYCVVNGEIYNYKELRGKLERRGHKFKTNIDTEVVLYSYLEYGNNFISQLNGIFAIIIYDKKSNSMFIGRDQLGIKPLYYTFKNSGYYCCSLSKPLAQEIAPNSSLNYKNLIKLLYRQSLSEPDTIYESVYSLPAGHYGVIKNSKFKKYQYYKLKTKLKGGIPILDEFKNTLQNVINSQSIVDTNKIAIALSNGVDSMLIGKMLKIDHLKGYNLPFNPFNPNYENNRLFNFKIHSIDYIKYVNDAYNGWISLIDQPPMDGFNTFLLSYGIKKDVKVLYSGLGADELFNGYPQFNQLFNIENKEDLILHFLKKTQVFPDNWLEELSSKFGLRFGDIKSELIHQVYIYTNEEVDKGNLLRELLIKLYLSSCLLRDADNNSMANGIELRVPYLDRNLLDYSMSYNYEDFFQNGNNKEIIKQTLNQILGFEYKKEKEGFTLNYQSFLTNKDVYFRNRNFINSYRNWCLKNINHWCEASGYENCNINS